MTRTITRLTDRLVNVFAPKGTARAVTACYQEFCFCSGMYLYQREVCVLSDGTIYRGNCVSVGKGC